MKPEPRQRLAVTTLVLLLGACLSPGTALAQNFGMPPAMTPFVGGSGVASIPQPSVAEPGVLAGITLGELRTDNLWLAPDGAPRSASWVTQVQPFVKAARSSPRFSGLFDYSLTGYWYSGASAHRQVEQRLDARGSLTLLSQHLFLDGTARYGRTIVNNELPAGPGTEFIDLNQVNVGVASLSPWWRQELGQIGTVTLRYTRARVLYNAHGMPGADASLLAGVPDVTSNSLQFNLQSPPYQPWGWSAGYMARGINPDFGASVRFARARVGVTRWVNNHLQLIVDAGKETQFRPDGTLQNLGAPFWSAGFEWTGPRNDFTLKAGHRFFGRSYDLAWTHQAALLTTRLSYREQPTDYNQELLQSTAALGGPPPLNFGAGIPSLAEQRPYLSKRWAGSVTYSMARSVLNLRVYDESRTFFAPTPDRERVATFGADWRFDIGARTTLTPSVYRQRQTFQDGQVNLNRYLQLALVHQFNRGDFASVRLRHDVNDVQSASPGAHGYSVNVLFLQWTHLL